MATQAKPKSEVESKRETSSPDASVNEAPNAEAQQPQSSSLFTKDEVTALVSEEKKRSEALIKDLEAKLARLEPLVKAQEIPEDVRSTATEIRAAERNAKALGRDFRLPASVVVGLARVLDPDEQEKMAKDLAPSAALPDVLQEAKKKLSAAEEQVPNLGVASGSPRIGPVAVEFDPKGQHVHELMASQKLRQREIYKKYVG